MNRMKKKITATVAIAFMCVCASIHCQAKGLYFVSGGDFRIPCAKYTVCTTQDNQTVNVTPEYVYLLSNYNNPNQLGKWSIVAGGHEYTFGEKDNINVGASNLKNGCSNVPPISVTFPHAGNHLVKVYDDKCNIYMMKFRHMDEISSLHLDWSERNYASTFGKLYDIHQISFLSNAKRIYFKVPENYRDTINPQVFVRLSNATEVVFGNAHVYKSFTSEDFMSYCSATNDMVFPSITNLDKNAFFASPNISYASFPKLVQVGSNLFNIWQKPNGTSLPANEIINNNLGLKVFGIGESLTSIGTNALWLHLNLHTVEFTTDKEDWISAWNNHPILPNWFGPATPIEGKDDEATLTPFATAPSIVYTVTNNHPKPTKLKLKR